MTAACVPKDDGCTKSGTGPGCTNADNSDGGKAFCLENVKKACDEKLKKCLDDCIQDNTKAYERDAAYRKLQKEAQLVQEAKRVEKCADLNNPNSPYRIANDRKNAYLAAIVAIVELSVIAGWNAAMPKPFQVDASSQLKIRQAYQHAVNDPHGGTGGAQGQGTLFGNYDFANMTVTLANKNPSLLASQLNSLQDLATQEQKKKDALCPPVKPLEPFDELEAQRGYNQKIARCMGACNYQAMADCKTSQCFCGLWKCPAGNQGPMIGDQGPGSNFPTAGADPSINIRDMSFTASAYDLPIELMYTRSYFPGNVIWVSPTTEIRTETVARVFVPGDVNAGTLSSYVLNKNLVIDTYISFMIGVCAGPVDAVQRIWMNGVLIYDVSAGADLTVIDQGLLEIQFFDGSEASIVSDFISQLDGFGLVPAYRGTACLLIKNINIKSFTEFPQFKIEVVKSVAKAVPQLESAVQANGDVSKIWKVDTAAHRLYMGTSTGMRTVDLDTLATISNVAVAHAADVTPLPYVVTVNGTTIGTNEVVYGTQQSTDTSAISFSKMFHTRLVDREDTGWDTLVLSNSSGDIYFYSFSDTESSQFSPSDWQHVGLGLYASFDAILSGALEAYVNGIFLHTEPGTAQSRLTQLFLGFRGEGGTIEIAGFTQNTTDSLETNFLQDDQGFTFDPLVLDGATSISVLGAHYSQRDRTVLLFLNVDGAFKVIKYDPYNGVVWSTTAASLPNWHGYEMGRHGDFRMFMWISGSTAYRLNVDTGAITTLDIGTFPTLGTEGRQYYDPKIGAITYYSNAGTIARLYVNRITTDTETLADVVRDVAERAGFDISLLFTDNLEDVAIKGYRSGTAITARDVLAPLFEVYPVVSYIDIGLSSISKGDAAVIEIPDDDLQVPFTSTRNTDAYDMRTAALTYFSIETDGELATQTFQLPEAITDVAQEITASYTVLEDDDYMMSLAELQVFAVQENDEQAAVQLAPRHLAVTPGDQLNINGKQWRVSQTNLGANLLGQIALTLDASNKYNELVALTGTLGFASFFQVPPFRPIPFPLMWAGRCTLPDMPLGGCVFMGGDNLTGDFVQPVQIGLGYNEDDATADTNSDTIFSDDVAYGYLVTPPSNDTRQFTSQPENSMVVKFVDPTHVARLLFYYNIKDMYRLPLQNMLFANHEHIRFKDFSVGMDGVTVTFLGLQRARDSTDMFMGHTAGELVMLYELYNTRKIQRSGTDFGMVKGASVSVVGEVRRSDKSGVDPDIIAPLPLCNVRRFDNGPAVPSITYPDALDINLYAALRLQNFVEFADAVTAYYDNTSNEATFDFCPNCNLDGGVSLSQAFILRGDYNQATFETWLNTAGGVFDSYVIASPVGSQGGMLFSAMDQETAAFDMTLETLTLVLISGSTTVTGTRVSTRAVTWTPGNYTFRRTRGIVKQ